jgi:hypothetical protein
VDPAQDTTEPSDQAEIDWQAQARKWESRAKANKAAADELAAIKDAAKSDAERQAEAIAKLTAERDQLASVQLKTQIAAAKGLPADAVTLLTGNDQASIEASADLLNQLITNAGAPKTPKPTVAQGVSPAKDNKHELREFAAQLFHTER